MGEFGAVYVVSGHIAGQTDTMPLRVEKLFQEYNLPGSLRRGVGADAAGAGDADRRRSKLEHEDARDQSQTCTRRRGRGGVDMSITIQNVSKRFGDFVASTTSASTSRTARCSRCWARRARARRRCCGSSPGWRCADAGTVLYDDEDVTNSSARDRNVGFVFQHYALFRHMTVFENIAFGLRVRKRPEGSKIRERVRELLQLVRLDGLEDRYPAAALRRPAAARRAGPRAGRRAEGAAARRAVRRAGRQGARGAAHWLRRLHDEFTSRASSSRTTRRRRSRWPTGSW